MVEAVHTEHSRGKRTRFESTALPLTKPIYNYALKLARNRDDANDLIQETFLRAYRTFENFEPGTNPNRKKKRGM